MDQKSRIIVLRCIKYGEADLIVHGIDTNGARINFLAKSALKSRKRFGGGVLEPTHYIDAVYRRPRSSSSEDPLYFLQEARLVESFPGIRQNYERLEMAFYFLKVISKVVQEGAVEDSEDFLLLGRSLRALEKAQDLLSLKTMFEIKVLHNHGVLPSDLQAHKYVKSPVSQYQVHSPSRLEERQALRGRVHHILAQYLNVN